MHALSCYCSLLLTRYFVLAKTDPNERPGKAFTGFVVDADSPGITKGRKVKNDNKVAFVVFPFENSFFCRNGTWDSGPPIPVVSLLRMLLFLKRCHVCDPLSTAHCG